ncbi:MAG: phospho-N-acetylmuramoyl-pentapeptide-transferase [Clostridiales bacterium]|jgi:phospho-N-acetylmuramoyl-pentapeptide-transferase|nr:phospho-N-acetylmuramoyl-pentapeptide-transferase [Clostridiales bacterium]
MNLNWSVGIPAIIAFCLSVVLSPIIIPLLARLKFGQFVRDDGPKSHLKKTGTPTMGGLIIIPVIIITSIIFVKTNPKTVPVLMAIIGYGIIGFLDDYLKVVKKRSLGLRAWQKMLGQILVTSILIYYIINYTDIGSSVKIPFSSGTQLDLGVMFIPIIFFIIIGTVNSVNLTDGLDGLASSVTVIVATFFAVVSIGEKSGLEPIACTTAGALLGFLLFNCHPAKIFMGDTGSLALGGFVAVTAVMLKMPIYLLIVGLVYVAETLSVIMQVWYFKATKGKRLFKMAPLHHHFELCGWTETKVVAVFSVITAMLCIIGLMGI